MKKAAVVFTVAAFFSLPNCQDSANAVISRILLLIYRHREELQDAEAYACLPHVCQSNWNRVR